MLLVLQHAPAEGLGRLGPALDRAPTTTVPLFAGAPVPGDLAGVTGVISLGGGMNVDETDQHPWIVDEIALLGRAHRAGLPVLGVCLGSQLLAVALGGAVSAMPAPEIGWRPVASVAPDPLFEGMFPMVQYHYHGRQVARLPPGAARLLSSAACPVQAFRVGGRTLGVQFHLEWSRDFILSTLSDEDVRPHAAAIRAGIDTYYAGYGQRGVRLAAQICAGLFGH